MIGSVFSGIGGLELGLERAGLGPVAFQVEIEPYCRHILERHWPGVPRYCDVRTATALPFVDVLCGGFPCQQLSAAGNKEGIGTREQPTARSGLWWEFDRIIGELQSTWVVIENVAHTQKRWVPVVRRCLHERGYASVPIRMRASDVGAIHERKRIFLVALRYDADPYGDLLRQLAEWAEEGREHVSDGRETQPRGEAADVDSSWQLQPEGLEPEQRRWPGDGAASDVERIGQFRGRAQSRRETRGATPGFHGSESNTGTPDPDGFRRSRHGRRYARAPHHGRGANERYPAPERAPDPPDVTGERQPQGRLVGQERSGRPDAPGGLTSHPLVERWRETLEHEGQRLARERGWGEDSGRPATDLGGEQRAQWRRRPRVSQQGEGEPAPGGVGRDEAAVSPGFGLSPRPWMVRGLHGLPGGLDGPWAARRWTGARLREARIRGLGNAVVPQCSEEIGWLIARVNALRGTNA